MREKRHVSHRTHLVCGPKLQFRSVLQSVLSSAYRYRLVTFSRTDVDKRILVDRPGFAGDIINSPIFKIGHNGDSRIKSTQQFLPWMRSVPELTICPFNNRKLNALLLSLDIVVLPCF